MPKKDYREEPCVRILDRGAIKRFVEIDRAEVVEGVFFWRGGALVHEKRRWDLPDWSKEEKGKKIEKYEKEYENGAIVIGAFLDSVLVGFAITKPIVVAGRPGMYELQQIVVSKTHRKKGVGTEMLALTRGKAGEIGAKAICVLSTPAEAAIRFYLSVGFLPTDVPDDEAFSWWDGEDVYMEMML